MTSMLVLASFGAILAGLFLPLSTPAAANGPATQAGPTRQPSAAADLASASHDIVIYGGTASAIAAAVQAKRMGKTVLVVSPDQHLGGLTSGGLGWTDSGKKQAIGGIAREFYHQVWEHYQRNDAWPFQTAGDYGTRSQGDPTDLPGAKTMWVFEPHVAESIFERWVRSNQLTVIRNCRLDRSPGGVTVREGRIESFRTLDGQSHAGKMFIDATYEGDLIAAAGVKTTVGREANAVYGETFNGNQVGVLHHAHFFAKPVDPYRIPGQPESGRLPEIDDSKPGTRGEGDHRVQAYCFRMCLTNVAKNRIPFPKPDGYDPDRYELLRRVFATGWKHVFRKFDPLPNHKTDTNNHGPFSTDFIGKNYDYPTANYERREEIIREHERYQKGLMYFLGHDPGVPADIREKVNQWGLCKDEFVDNGGWPHQLYIREARRMIGSYVMTEQDCLDQRVTPDSIGMGSYTLDSHNVRRYITPDGTVQNEGDIGVPTPRPYEIAYGAILPRKAECENLLAPVCVSASHIAFGSIRMEPVFMILGQSASTAASIAIDQKVSVQDVPIGALQNRLKSDGQILQWDGPSGSIRMKDLEGYVVDDNQAEKSGVWQASHSVQPYVASGYRHNLQDPAAVAIFSFRVPPGRYEVRASYTANANRCRSVQYGIRNQAIEVVKELNQRQKPDSKDGFASLGTYELDGEVTIRVQAGTPTGYTIIDAIQLRPIR